MSNRFEVLELSVCADCIGYIANGELPPDTTPARNREIVDGCAQFKGLCAGDSDQDDEFSWRPCDTCRTRLGGTRHQAIDLVPRAEGSSR